MKIHILSQYDAEGFVPAARTYCICIGVADRETADPRLSRYELCNTQEYKFDDTYPGDRVRFDRDIIFNPEIAREIIEDFNRDYQRGDNLLVHCAAGVSRSPAVGLALNTIFHLDWRQQIPLLKRFQDLIGGFIGQ